MTKKNAAVFSIVHLLINSVVFWLSFSGIFRFQGSVNILFGFMCAEILNIESYLTGSIIYLSISTIMLYYLAQTTLRKFENIMLIVLGLILSLPLLNFNGL